MHPPGQVCDIQGVVFARRMPEEQLGVDDPGRHCSQEEPMALLEQIFVAPVRPDSLVLRFCCFVEAVGFYSKSFVLFAKVP